MVGDGGEGDVLGLACRSEVGESGSADKVLKIAADHQAHGLVRWTCFFAEKSALSFCRLESLVAEYRSRGVDARAFNGNVLGLMDQVLAAAVGRPLFLFLDPCGLALLNFSMMAVHRIGDLTATEARVPHALVEHDKDETAARTLNMSLRKYRAHVADLMARLGAVTRFQAALRAKERGWL